MTLRTWRRTHDRAVQTVAGVKVVRFGNPLLSDQARKDVWDLHDYYVSGTDGMTFYLRRR